MTNLLTSAKLGDALVSVFYGFFLLIDSVVYWFISVCYQVFVLISQVNLFSESTLREIIDRIFTILGVVMLFIMAYQIILLILDPDKVKGENGAKKTIFKIVTSIVLIVILPTIYKYMSAFQTDVLTSNVIGRIVMGGGSTSKDSEDKIKKGGSGMAVIIASAFFHPMVDGVEYTYLSCKEDGAPAICEKYITTYETAEKYNTPGDLFLNSDLQDGLKWEEKDSKMRYIPILSTIAALFAIKMIIAFCLDIGVRVAKLGFLQISAPISIAMNIGESQSIFQTKWFKSLKDTYLEIFMKLVVIYFAMFSISLVPEVLENLWPDNGDFIIQLFATVFVILGILQFAKDGPKLIKDLFNMDLDFSIKKRLNENTYAQRVAATGLGGISSLASNVYDGIHNKKGALNIASSAVGGLVGGAKHGWKQSEGIDKWDRVRGVAAEARAESDEARTRRDNIKKRHVDDRIKYKEDHGIEITEKDKRTKPITSAFYGTVTNIPRDILDKKEQFVRWLAGETAPAKYKAANAVSAEYDSFLKRYENAAIRNVISTQEKQVSRKRMGEDVREIYAVEDGKINYDKPIDPKQVSIKEIDDFYKAEKLRLLNKNFNNEMNKRAVMIFGQEFVKNLSKSLDTLGVDAQKRFLKATEFKSLGEIEKIFTKVGDEKVTQLTEAEMLKLDKINGALKSLVNEQLAQQKIEAEKSNK